MDFFIITRRYILVGPFMCLGARPKHIKALEKRRDPCCISLDFALAICFYLRFLYG